MRRADPTRPWCVRVLDSTGIPGHALHEKGLQRQKGVGPLVSSQEQRALLVPVINRCQPVVNRGFCSRIGLHRISLVRASGETFRRRVFDALEGTRDACLLGEQFCRRPVLPDPAPPPRRAPRPDPPVVCPGFGFDKFIERFSIAFPDMPCMKRVYKDKKASVHWSAARNKERFSSR